jgi:MYXO-CTERM domain-containing protein
MLRSLSAVALASMAVVAPASAEIWTVGHGGSSHFYTVAEAMGDVRVQDGDTIRIASGGYIGDMDFSSRALTIEPGNSPGIVDVYGNMFVGTASTVNFELSGLQNGLGSGVPEFDQFIVTGSVSYAGKLKITLFGAFSPSLGDSFALIQSGGALNFTGSTILPTLSGGLSWSVAVVAGSSEFGSAGSSLVASVVPAPGAVALIGLAGLATSRRRRA